MMMHHRNVEEGHVGRPEMDSRKMFSMKNQW